MAVHSRLADGFRLPGAAIWAAFLRGLPPPDILARKNLLSRPQDSITDSKVIGMRRSVFFSQFVQDWKKARLAAVTHGDRDIAQQAFAPGTLKRRTTEPPAKFT